MEAIRTGGLFALLASWAAMGIVFAADWQGQAVEELAALVPELAGDDAKEAEKALGRLRTICARVSRPGAERERAALCKAMVPHLALPTPNAVRLLVLAQMERIGGVECVEALAGLLDDRDLPVRQYALRALTANSDAAATAVIRKALGAAHTDEARVALINALGSSAEAGVSYRWSCKGTEDRAARHHRHRAHCQSDAGETRRVPLHPDGHEG